MSRETAEAQFDAARADRAWRDHYQNCAGCGRAIRQRRWQDCCDSGWALRHEQISTARALGEARKLDRMPSPGQASLF